MSISASTCHYLRALGVSGIPSSVTQISIFAWAKSTADNSAYCSIIHLDSNDGAGRVPGIQLTTGGSDGVALRVAEGGTEVIHGSDTDPGIYWWQGANRNNWFPMSAWLDTTASTLDAASAWGTTQNTADKDVTNPLVSTLDDFYVLRRDNVIWSGGTDDTQANIRIAHLAIWFGYKLTDTDRTNLLAGTNPQDIGTGATKRFYWPLVTQAGDGLVDDINGVTLTAVGGSATETWYDADNPTVNAPSGGSVDGSATGATLTGTSSLTAGIATGTTAGTANGATLTGTSSLTAGSVTGNATGSFTTAAMENNTGSGLLSNTAVEWTLYYGTIGSAPSDMAHGSGTTNASGVLSGSGAPLGAADLWVRTPDGVGIYYQRLTVA